MRMGPFEDLYGRPCRSPTCWLESPDVVIVNPQLLQEAAEKMNFIIQKIKVAQDREQKLCRCEKERTRILSWG